MDPLRERQLAIIRELGNGAFGRALLVRHIGTNTQYVAKEVNLRGMLPRDIEDSKNEVEVMMQLEHPNITRFINSFEAEQKIYTIMEFADGGDLAMRIGRQITMKKLFAEDTVTNIFIQICLALKYLHQKKFLHRDIKVQNIFMTSTDIVKLGDFGVSKHVGTVGIARTVCGTYSYFSPEMCRRQAYSNKSDVFALGVVLYEMLTLGKKPFTGKDTATLLRNIAFGKMEPLPNGLPYSEGLIAVLHSLLRINPTERPNIPLVLSTPYMQAQLKVFAKHTMEKEKYLKTQCTDSSPPQTPTRVKPVNRLLGGLFGKRPKPQPSPPPSPAPAPQKVDTRVKFGKQDMAGFLNSQPEGYQEEVNALKSGKVEKGGPCSVNYEATARDCKSLVILAADQKPVTADTTEIYESEEKARDRCDRMKEYLILQIGLEKLQRCLQVLEVNDDCTAQLTEILGKDKEQLIPLIMGCLVLPEHKGGQGNEEEGRLNL